jgi:hypothetical protein
MTTLRIDRQNSTGLFRHNIEHALLATGKDVKHLQPAALGVLEDFHTSGSNRHQPAGRTGRDHKSHHVLGGVTAGTAVFSGCTQEILDERK